MRRIVVLWPLGGDIRWFSPSTADGPSNQWSGGAESIFNKSILSAWNRAAAQPLLLGHLAAQPPYQAQKSEKPELWQKEGVTRLSIPAEGSDTASLAESNDKTEVKIEKGNSVQEDWKDRGGPECCLSCLRKHHHSQREKTQSFETEPILLGGQGGKEFTSKSQCDETMSTFEYRKFDDNWEKEKVDYFLGWWLGRTRVTAVLSPVVALARQTGGYWGKRRGTSFFKYICKKEENMFWNTFWVERRGKAFHSTRPLQILVHMSVRQQFNNSNPRSCQTSHNIVGKRRTSAIIRRWQWQWQRHKDNDRRKLSSPFPLQE